MDKEKLVRLARAINNALENDYCTSEFPEYEGSRYDELVNKITAEILKS